MFGVPKHIAFKMAIKSINVVQKKIISFRNLKFIRVQQNLEKWRKNEKCILGSKTPKNDLLTLNYGLPVTSPLHVLEGLLNAAKVLYWNLMPVEPYLVIPFWKAQSHEKRCENLQKTEP